MLSKDHIRDAISRTLGRASYRGQVIDFLRPHKDRIKEINFDSAGPGEYFDRDLDHAGFRGLNGVNVGEASK